jgi:hypothetical protein
MAATIIDNASAGFSVVGTWGTYSLSGSNQYGSNYRFSASGSGADVATWSFTGLTAGSYQVSLCWASNSSHAQTAPYKIYVNSTLITTATVDQRFDPAADVVHSGSNFQHANSTPITIQTGDTLEVTVDDSSTGTVIADAVAVDTTTPTPSGNVIVIED